MIAPGTATATNSSTIIVAGNTDRCGLVIRNISRISAYLAFGCAAVVNRGIVLKDGEAFTMDALSHNVEAVYAITAAETATFAIQEFGYQGRRLACL